MRDFLRIFRIYLALSLAMASSLTQADVLPDESQYASKVQNEKIF
jgi:hypothetical protein